MHVFELITIYNCRFGLDTQYPIILDNVNCSTPNYLTILQCDYNTNISSSCVHGSDDVSVTCCELLTDNYLNCKKIKVTYTNKLQCISYTPTMRCIINYVLTMQGHRDCVTHRVAEKDHHVATEVSTIVDKDQNGP